MNLIQDHVINNASNYREEFLNAKPFRHVVIDNFFKEDKLAKLLEEFPGHGSKDGLVGDYGGKSKKGGRSDVREFGPTFREWDDLAQTREFLDLIGSISGIDDLQYDPDYNGAGIHENFKGKRGNIHIDYNYHPKTLFHRRLNAIIYITPGWKAEYGGGLKIYEYGQKPSKGVKKVIPCLFNRCAMFETTEDSWHGVQSIYFPEGVEELSRKSITIYFYTKDRPEELTAERHSTIYYPGEVLEGAKLGLTLNKNHIDEIKNFENRANMLIHNIYKEHSRLYEKVSKLKKANENLRSKLQRHNIK